MPELSADPLRQDAVKTPAYPAQVIVYTDGASRGNPGPGAYGIAVTSADGTVIDEKKKTIGDCTNNYAEYMAVIEALKLCHKKGAKKVVVRADSQLMVRQMLGQYKVKAEVIIPLYLQVKKLLAHFETVTFEHIRREQNAHADRLANEALDHRS